jgi:zinc/manganese transport system substrate-binding protein
MNRLIPALAFSLALVLPAAAEPISILAAENFYGEAATAIGGDRVAVESVIVAAGTDPHDFEPPASVARGVADADIVIMNGADYDHWMEHLLEASSGDGRVVIDVASLIGVEEGDNPHIWYDPKAMPALANALADALIAADPAGKADYEARRDAFLATLAPIDTTVADLRARFAGTAVIATEPVFGYMADAIGLTMQNEAFQTAIMNETEPAASDIAAVEDDIRSGRVRVLFYNAQVEDAFTKNLADLARDAGVPVVGVTETQPEGKSFAEWMTETLGATAKALGDTAS